MQALFEEYGITMRRRGSPRGRRGIISGAKGGVELRKKLRLWCSYAVWIRAQTTNCLAGFGGGGRVCLAWQAQLEWLELHDK